MLSIPLGPVASPVAPVLLLLAVWVASRLASRLASSVAAKHHSGNAVLNAADAFALHGGDRTSPTRR
jgi:hypothetical protein